MRACGVVTPVLVLAERDAMPERIRGLEMGADDYCARPVDPHQVASRLRALVRHARGQPQECLRLHGLVLDPAALTVSLDGEPVLLKPREFDLLHLLMLNVGRVLSREQLGRELHRWGQEVQSNTVEVHVHHLRRKLRPALIRTVRGVGYVLPRDPGAHR
jgi:DNA-binding response OmpR family regulator